MPALRALLAQINARSGWHLRPPTAGRLRLEAARRRILLPVERPTGGEFFTPLMGNPMLSCRQ